jgi:hypothetical protein
VPKIPKPELGVKKPRGSDIKLSNPLGDQVTHFAKYTKSLNAKNSYCNYKKIRTTFDTKPTICISSTNKRTTQARWVVVGQRVKR